MIKQCYQCKQEKNLIDFRKCAQSKDGHSHICRECARANSKKPKKIKEVLPDNQKRCCRCGVVKDKTEFNKSSKDKDGYKPACAQCRRQEAKEYKKANKEQIREKGKAYRKSEKGKKKNKERQEKNKDKLKKYLKEYKNKNRDTLNKKCNERAKTDHNHYIRLRVRSRVLDGFNSYSKNGKTKSCKEYGIDFEKLVAKLGPKPNKDYQLDHIIPVIVFDFDKDSHVFLCNHQENLQWLPKEENRKKQDKIIWSLIEGNVVLESICLELGITKDDDGKDGREIRERLYPT